MPDQEGGHVALFIDWDNLAISTAADHSGALPDLRRIVQVAQTYGTLLLARAYAEWGVTSERLSVYRAGVEPVYAPTFRFEADQPGQPVRGKSLADPCLVADCVDALHLHAGLATLVLVSGDKDLIPIVRLAQLRGKRVVVIGPDLVAAVLRDMADEYVPYRSLVAGADHRSDSVRAEAAELIRRRRRRGRGGRSVGDPVDQVAPPDVTEPQELPQTDSGAVQPGPESHRAPRHERRERRPFLDRAGVFRPAGEPETPRPEEPEVTEARAPEAPVAPPVQEPVAALPEPELEPRPQPPAQTTSPVEPAAAPAADRQELLDTIASILRERTSAGRPRLRATNLKDYLLARMPGFSERQYGFSRFSDLLAEAERANVLEVTTVGQVQWIALPGASATSEVAAPAPAPQPAPAETPAAVPAGPVLANEDAVAGIVELRHRTRLLTYNLVVSALAGAISARGADVPAEDEARRTIDRMVDEGAVRVDREPQEVELNGARHRVRLCHVVDEHPLVSAAEDAWHSQASVAAESPAQLEAEPTTEPAVEPGAATEPSAASGSRRRSRSRGRRGASASAEAEPRAEESAQQASESAPESGGQATQDEPVARVFDALVDAVRESIAPGKATAGAAGVKSRLTRALPNFSERELGYSKFKDFLLAAERAGRVRVETAGAATRVGLPDGGEPTAE